MSDVKIEKFDQIGIVVKNIEKSTQYFGGLLKFQSKLNIVEQNSTVIYKGEEVVFKMKKIMQNFGGKQLEIVEVVESSGDHLYLDFICINSIFSQKCQDIYRYQNYFFTPRNLI